MKSNRGFPAFAPPSRDYDLACPDITARLSRRNGSDRSYQLADTNFTKFTPIDQLFVIIRVIRVFTAAFPRRVFEIAGRRVTGRILDRVGAAQE